MKPETRKEAYLAAIGGQDVDVPAKPITREEAYLAAILNNGLGAKNLEDLADVQIVDPVNGYVVKFDAELGKWVAGPASGSGGTSDYTDLANKPQIDGNTLAGNKSAEDLGLARSGDIPTKVSDLDNDVNFISDADYVHTDNNYDDTAKGIVNGVTEALAGKQDELTFDNIPTENSTNPVKSGGVYSADEAIRQWTTAEAKSVSGNPITLTDGSARNAEGLAVTCNPKQNLHGYDHPWAGGAGKNKYSGNSSVTLEGVGRVIPADFPIYLTAGTYTVSFKFSGTVSGQCQCIMLDSTKTTPVANLLITLQSGLNSFTLTISEPAYYITVYSSNTNGGVYSDIQLEEGSTATSYTPYSNECPITGLTECVVDRDGKNLLPLLATTRTVNGITYTVNDGIVTMNNTATGLSYLVLSNATNDLNDLSNVLIKAGTPIIVSTGIEGKGLVARYTDGSYENLSSGLVFTPGKDIALVYIQYGSGTTLNNVKLYPMIRLASVSDATFEPYFHYTATITFGQTVYGGSVDFKTGKVSVTYGIVDLGSLTWGRSSQGLFNALITGIKASANAICSIYVKNQSLPDKTFDIGSPGYFEGKVIINDTAYSDTATFTTAMDGVQLCYELATPTELTLTPAELELLKGYNYISTNGTTIALAYLPDSLLAEAENYVDEKIPPAPSSDGTYVLTCTVTSGTPAYSWESAT